MSQVLIGSEYLNVGCHPGQVNVHDSLLVVPYIVVQRYRFLPSFFPREEITIIFPAVFKFNTEGVWSFHISFCHVILLHRVLYNHLLFFFQTKEVMTKFPSKCYLGGHFTLVHNVSLRGHFVLRRAICTSTSCPKWTYYTNIECHTLI